MCGIAGVIGRQGQDLDYAGIVEAMLDLLRHRGPDGVGIAVFGPDAVLARASDRASGHQASPGVAAGLGHRRLAIIDLTPEAGQPMFSADGSLALVFNGEIYNYIELREELRERWAFRTNSDSEVLLAAYRVWGDALLGRLDGMFAFAILDLGRNRLFCARDQFGIKPFYFGIDDGALAFASEPRAVLAALRTKGHVDLPHLAEFLVLATSDYDEGTFYREVKQLRPGHCMEVDLVSGKVSSSRYWIPPEVTYVSDKAVIPEVWRLLERGIARQLRSDVPVGASLSGGLDSSVVVNLAARLLGHNANQFRAFTSIAEGHSEDESGLAARSAALAGVQWCPVRPVGEAVAKDLTGMVWSMDEPFTSLAMFAHYQVMRAAANSGIKVMLDGQGSDEVFVGYPRVAQSLVWEKIKGLEWYSAGRDLFLLRRNAAITFREGILGGAYRGLTWVRTFRAAHNMRPMLRANLLSEARYEVVQDATTSSGLVDLQLKELTRYVLPRLLRYEDRNSMAFSIEARVPLLSIDLAQFALSLPVRWRVRDGWTKFALRSAAANWIPPGVLNAKGKKGFPVPQAEWVRLLGPTINEFLSEHGVSEVLDVEAVRRGMETDAVGSHWFWRCLSAGMWIAGSKVAI